MNVSAITRQLKAKYPKGNIILNKDDNGIVIEIICEVESSLTHPMWSTAVAVIDRSKPHFHKRSTEVWNMIKGELTLFINEKEYKLKEGYVIRIRAGTVHYAIGNESWVEINSTPGWDPDDHYPM